MAPQLGYKGAGGNLNTMPLQGNPNPNNVIRIEYEVPLDGHDCDYKPNTTLLLPFHQFLLDKKTLWGCSTVAGMNLARRRNVNPSPSVKIKINHWISSFQLLKKRWESGFGCQNFYFFGKKILSVKPWPKGWLHVMWRTGSVVWYRVDIGLPWGHLARNDDKFTHFLPNYLLLGTFSPSGPSSTTSQLFLTTLLRPVLRLDFFNTLYLGKKQTHINSLLLMSSFLQEFKKTKFFFL